MALDKINRPSSAPTRSVAILRPSHIYARVSRGSLRAIARNLLQSGVSVDDTIEEVAQSIDAAVDWTTVIPGFVGAVLETVDGVVIRAVAGLIVHAIEKQLGEKLAA